MPGQKVAHHLQDVWIQANSGADFALSGSTCTPLPEMTCPRVTVLKERTPRELCIRLSIPLDAEYTSHMINMFFSAFTEHKNVIYIHKHEIQVAEESLVLSIFYWKRAWAFANPKLKSLNSYSPAWVLKAISGSSSAVILIL